MLGSLTILFLALPLSLSLTFSHLFAQCKFEQVSKNTTEPVERTLLRARTLTHATEEIEAGDEDQINMMVIEHDKLHMSKVQDN